MSRSSITNTLPNHAQSRVFTLLHLAIPWTQLIMPNSLKILFISRTLLSLVSLSNHWPSFPRLFFPGSSLSSFLLNESDKSSLLRHLLLLPSILKQIHPILWLKCHPYVNHSQIYISSLNISPDTRLTDPTTYSIFLLAHLIDVSNSVYPKPKYLPSTSKPTSSTVCPVLTGHLSSCSG